MGHPQSGAGVLLEMGVQEVVAQLGQPWIPLEKRVRVASGPEGRPAKPGVVGWAPAELPFLKPPALLVGPPAPPL